MYIAALKKMFAEVVVKQDAAAIPLYYHQDFILYTNGHEINYNDFLVSHHRYYASPVKYSINYDKETLLEQDDKVAGRIWVTLTETDGSSKKIEMLLIAQFKDNKIYRVWELTYPDWTKLENFQ